jgi:uncharacterized protein (TIGR03437 family)
MKRLVLLLAGLTPLMAADPARDARWLQDLNTLSTQLPQLHANLFFKTPRSVFDQAVSNLRNTIPQLTDTQVMAGLARIVALPGEGHTNLFLTQVPNTFRQLPLILQWFEDGLFITAANPAYPRAVGARVLRIGDRTVEEAYQAVGELISHENDGWVRQTSPSYLVIADLLQALGIAPDNTSVRFQLQDLRGECFTLDIASLNPGQSGSGIFAPDPKTGFIPLTRQRTSDNYWFSYIASSRTLYFAYNRCADQPGLPFAQFNAQLWAAFDINPVEHLIIDLRNNEGGNSAILAPFLQAGAARMVRFSLTKPVVLIGRRTFSSAILNAIDMRQGPVMLVGEPTGGSPNSYGEVKTLTLPNSQLRVNYSTRYFSFSAYPPGPMLPDVTVPFYSADYFARHDPFLAAALANSATRPAALTDAISVVNAATFRAGDPVAPGSIAALFGDFSISSPQILINGFASPVFASVPGQINFRVPDEVAPGIASIQIKDRDSVIAEGNVRIASAAPGLFISDPFSPSRPGAVLDENSRLITAETPASRGSAIQIFGTGQGAPGTPRIYIGAELADVLYSGAHPDFPGLWQINARVPDSASIAGEAPVFVVAGSSASNAVTVRIAN